ncbi:MAG: hypothetical protein JW731_04755 [Bacteroidales bacterium]|nr:hypothetical protein [Bacteroidales bacterium]
MKKLIFAVFLFLTACLGNSNDGSNNVLARVHNDYLYQSEIKNLVLPGTNARDSMAVVQNYINNWILQKLILYKAESNLHEEDKQFKKQLEDYRNSLVIYTYESKLVSQYLDTVVSDEEIESYYNDNLGNFQLKDNIVKTYYARFESELPEIRKIRGFFYSDSPEYRDSLDVYIEKYSNLYYLNDEVWILFMDLLRYVPIQTYNEEAYLQNHRKIEIVEEPYLYLVNIVDFKIKEGVSPLSFEKENIRQIILNKRKLSIINQMRDEVFESGLRNNDFEIY